MGTKSDPGNFNCYENAMEDEPMFILLGRDKQAPAALEKWANERAKAVRQGKKPEEDMEQVHDARKTALEMKAWRRKRHGDWRDQPKRKGGR